MANIILLGGNGFIGSNLAGQLINNGHHVIIFDQFTKTNSTIEELKTHLQLIKGDYNNRKQLEDVFNNHSIDIVIHLISTLIPSTDFNTLVSDLDTNLKATMQLIDCMRDKNINKIIFFSSGGTVYGENGLEVNKENDLTNPINYYGWMKLTTEKYIQLAHHLFGLQYLIVRPSNAYGINQNLYGSQGLIAVALGKLLSNQPLEIWGDGSNVRDYVYVDDIVRAVYMLVGTNHWNEIYNIGSHVGTSVNRVLDIIQEITGKKLEITYNSSRAIDIPVNILNCEKITRHINWRPYVSLKSGISKMWQAIS